MNDKHRVIVNAYLRGGQKLADKVAVSNGYNPLSRQRIHQIMNKYGIKRPHIHIRNIENALRQEYLILEMYEAGYPIRDIAQKLMLKITAVKYVLGKNESKVQALARKRNKKFIPIEVEDEIIKGLENGEKIYSLARRLNVAHTTIYRAKNRLKDV